MRTSTAHGVTYGCQQYGPTRGWRGHRFGGMALAGRGWQQPRHLRAPLRHTIGVDCIGANTVSPLPVPVPADAATAAPTTPLDTGLHWPARALSTARSRHGSTLHSAESH